VKLAPAIALADPEIEAAVRQEVEGRGLFGEERRVVPGQHEHGSAEAHCRRLRGEIGQEVQRRRDLAETGEMVLDQEDAVKAERLRFADILDVVVVDPAVAGLLAGITGNRADGIIIDDPVANREQADSPTIREKIYNEYIDTAMTRAKPNMWAIIIQTRWHEEDLAGAILPADYNGESGMLDCRDGQRWEVLCIPAEAEREDDPLGRKPGEFLWPEWFSREHWSTWRDNPRAARTWAALYQQRPAPFTGVHFNREMFRYYDPDLAPVDA